MTENNLSKPIKAVGLLSAGLDSTLAAKIIKDLGFEVHALHFDLPWGCENKFSAEKIAAQLNIKLIIMNLGEEFLKEIQNARYGYGSAFNPCIDCHAYMLKLARNYMEKNQAAFVFTGEVLGQRPMSQLKQSLKIVEKASGLEGRLLRPLSARLLEPTIPEMEGIIDRERLLSISGRSRSEQFSLAKELNVTGFRPPAGGCLLTDKNFSSRLKDVFKHGYRDLNEIVSLKWGRHFRLSDHFKIIVGRNDEENTMLKKYAHSDDHILEISVEPGPTLILKGQNPSNEILGKAAGFVQYYSKLRLNPPTQVTCRLASEPTHIKTILAQIPTDAEIKLLKV